MNILFIHQNFPAQFKHLAPSLKSDGHQVLAISHRPTLNNCWQGIQIANYDIFAPNHRPHPWLIDFSSKFTRAQACQQLAFTLKNQGFTPDIVIAHPGWGESLFIKDVWPDAKLALYCEFHYLPEGADVGFDPEFPTDPILEHQRIALKNINNYLHYEIADAGISPTHWQASSLPASFRSKISVIHDGIDTNFFKPNPNVEVTLKLGDSKSLTLSKKDKVLTYSARNLEPYRGFHIFMRAIPAILAGDPDVRIIIMGDDGVSYGNPPANHPTWKAQLIDEIEHEMNPSLWSRVHFLGRVETQQYLQILQLSRLHVYLTYPFVLSWGLLEALSCGCEVLVSDTAPLKEITNQLEPIKSFDFFKPDELADQALRIMSQVPTSTNPQRARKLILEQYALSKCLEEQKKWVYSLK